MRTHNTNGNATVNTTVIPFVRKNQIMNLLDNSLADWHIIPYQLTNVVKGFLVAYRLHMVFERFLVYRKASEYKVCFTQSECVAFNGVGIICVFNDEFLVEPCNFSLGQRSSAVKLLLFLLDS